MRVTGKSIVWQGRFLRTAILDYEDRRGNARQWEVVERTGTDGVVIIAAITPAREALLIRQYRPALDSYVIELPAGLIEPDESPSRACRRELVEETGHYSEDITPLSSGVISTGVLAERWHAMLAAGARPATGDELKAFPPDESEDIEVIRIGLDSAFEDLSAMEAAGELVDIRIYGLLELARRRMEG